MLDLATLVVPRTHQQILGNVSGARIRYRGADSLALSPMHLGPTRPDSRSPHHASKGTLLVPSRPITLSKRPTPVWPSTDTRVCSSLGSRVTWGRHARIKT